MSNECPVSSEIFRSDEWHCMAEACFGWVTVAVRFS